MEVFRCVWGNEMNLFETGRKRDRLTDDSVFDREIPAGIYNLIQGGIVAIGWAINLILLFYLQSYMKDMNPFIMCFLYIAVFISGIVLATEVPYTFMVIIGYFMIVAPVGIVAASVIDLFSEKSGAEVALQAVVVVLCVTAVVTFFACICPDYCDKLLPMLGIGSIGQVPAAAITSLAGWDVSIWAWLAALFICFCFIYDMAHSQIFSRTVKHAVDCAVDICVDTAFAIIRIPVALIGLYLE